MQFKELTFSAKHEKLIILCLCLIGAARIFIFNAAFPLFNNVDEILHFDLVHKYSQEKLPHAQIEQLDNESLKFWILYGTPEYLCPPGNYTVPPPMWTKPNVEQSPTFARYLVKVAEENLNIQAGSFPVYYFVAGVWYNAGQVLGFTGGQMLYWLRFFNIPVFVLLIWVSYFMTSSFYPQAHPARIAVPLLIAFFPQDAFYSISNDALSPLMFAAAFFMLIQIYLSNKSYSYHFFAGFLVSITFLTKLSNIAIIAAAIVVILFKIKQLYSNRQVVKYLPNLVLFSVGLIIPTALCLLRNYLVLGDLFGTSEKAAALSWTVKPISQLLDHPIFSIQGASHFLSRLTEHFWRGEFTWHLTEMASRPLDIFYVASTALFIIISLASWFKKSNANEASRFAIIVSFCVIIVSVLFLAFLSVRFDFGTCYNPSRQEPFFTSGRLIDGMLVPFLLVYVDGLQRVLLFFRCRRCLVWAAVVITTAITCSEILISLVAFKSQYNWFHLQ